VNAPVTVRPQRDPPASRPPHAATSGSRPLLLAVLLVVAAQQPVAGVVTLVLRARGSRWLVTGAVRGSARGYQPDFT